MFRLILLLFVLSGCVNQAVVYEEGICSPGIEYEHSQQSPIQCKCPQGYGFETVSTGWEQCDQGECPISTLACQKII